MNTNTLVKGLLGIGAAAAAYAVAVRPWHLRWGARDEELTMPLPGDEVKPGAGINITHAITIDAPAESVWQWLVQIGQGRGGFFSYDWLENLFDLEIHNVYEVKPDLQQLKIGDFVRAAHKGWLGGRFDGKAGWFVTDLEPNRHLVLRDRIELGSWSFILRPLPQNKTRFIIRARGDRPANLLRWIFHLSVFEPAHFIMERKMMLTLKQLAERPKEAVSTPEQPKTVAASAS